MTSPLDALSPLDGRYLEKVSTLRDFFSEGALVRRRLELEVRWLLYLADARQLGEVPAPERNTRRQLLELSQNFDTTTVRRIKNIEKRCRHDVKAVEIFLREQLQALAENTAGDAARDLLRLREFVHFGCTSEDINNLCWALMIRDADRQVLQPARHALLLELRRLSRRTAKMPMLSRTHGQPATPTTLGKELANFCHRLQRQQEAWRAVPIQGKMNGAVGNYNAHLAAWPRLNWRGLCRTFVKRLGLQHNPMSTQIEPRDWMAEWFHAAMRHNVVLLDLCRDLWSYVALEYFRQRAVPAEVGSSTMPHKLNPIDFENAEGNLGLANAMLAHLADKLPVSRWQRDLSDSTVLRNIGVALGHGLLACQSARQGLQRLEPDAQRMRSELDSHWEVLTEAVQTVMRRHGIPEPYEKLRVLSRGRELDRETLHAFIQTLELPQTEKQRLLRLRPSRYLGLAVELARAKDPR